MNRFFYFLLLGAAAFLLLGCVTINQNAVDPRLFSPRRTNTVTAVQVSDAHFSREKPLFDNTIALINELNPDIIFFTGDQAVSEKSVAVMKHYLSQITVDAPKLAINGNWEYTKGVPLAKYKRALAECGFTLLENAGRAYDFGGKKLYVYGVDDYLFGSPSFADFEPRADGANAVLAHCPPLFDSLVAWRAKTTARAEETAGESATADGAIDAEKAAATQDDKADAARKSRNADTNSAAVGESAGDSVNTSAAVSAPVSEPVPIVMLSGHTHGGQFTFWGKAIYFPIGTGTYYSGFYTNGANTLYVSTGLGNSSYDIRNVPPVIDVITFVYNEQNEFVTVNAEALAVPK